MDEEHARGATRWWQLVLGVICMSMIANLQYGWTLFVNPIEDKHHWGLPAIQVAFTVFVVVETWLVPFEGYLVDRFGPRIVAVTSGALVAAAWVINSQANTVQMLYVGAAIGGIGAGGVYGACVGNALKWFPDRRGLAAGVTAMGFGAGSALTVYPIANMIRTQGYETAFLKFGIAQGVVVAIVGWWLKRPDNLLTVRPGKTTVGSGRESTPMEMLRSPAFWVMYVMFILTATGGLIATAQIKPIATDFGIAADATASLGILTVLALPFALAMSRVLNGISRPFFGWVSDHWGRERTMCAAFALEGVAFLLLNRFGADPTAFVLTTSLIFFAYGEIYSLFPAACADWYGKKYASANAGLLYTGKGAAALIVPLSSILAVKLGGWSGVFVTLAGMNLLAALMALLVLKPLRPNAAGGTVRTQAPQAHLDPTT
ncbi:MAG TPA: oxalate/formate MFS antiporter [Gemmatimonadaceae bacterium]|nr:oxalate/formate MFS antiporter [Gemmatimonadaceae bacterium]